MFPTADRKYLNGQGRVGDASAGIPQGHDESCPCLPIRAQKSRAWARLAKNDFWRLLSLKDKAA